jgi:L-rhamnose mutarotase
MTKQNTKIKKRHAEVQREHVAKLTAAGWKRRSIFVPPHGQADFNAAIAKLRKKWGKV